MAQIALRRTDNRTKALGDIVSVLLGMDEPRRRLAAEMSGLNIHLRTRRVGTRSSDAACRPGHRQRPAAGLHPAARWPVRCSSTSVSPAASTITPWADRVQLIDAKYVGTWELPAIGAVTAPTAVLVRPNGYVAWVGDLTQVGLADALTTWFGLRRSAPRKHMAAMTITANVRFLTSAKGSSFNILNCVDNPGGAL
jgi:3-(3-hydroxy-phenyl)propionate hydroxylase